VLGGGVLRGGRLAGDRAACGGLMEGKKQAHFCALGRVRRSWVEQLVSIRWVGLVLSKSYIIEQI
jgi:hypothetical protein